MPRLVAARGQCDWEVGRSVSGPAFARSLLNDLGQVILLCASLSFPWEWKPQGPCPSALTFGGSGATGHRAGARKEPLGSGVSRA